MLSRSGGFFSRQSCNLTFRYNYRDRQNGIFNCQTPYAYWATYVIKLSTMWLRDKGLRRLNFGIGLMFATGASTGYIGSLTNGLLILPYCKIERKEPG